MSDKKRKINLSQYIAKIFGRQDESEEKIKDNPDFIDATVGQADGDSAQTTITDASRYPDIDEENTKSFFQDYISEKGKLFNKENNNWKLFAIESISYSVLVLVIGIIGGNLENISNLKDPDNDWKNNSYLLRNKFEGLFKHSLSADSPLKIDESVYKDSSVPKDLKVWCSLCDLGVQAKLLLQSWPLKIFDYGNWAMCELTWNAFDSFFTKGKAFKAYFIPIFLIIIIYFQIPLIIGFLVALLGSAQHPNFPLYWLGVFAYLSYIKSIVRPFFKFILGGNCTRLLARPDTNYMIQTDMSMTKADSYLINSLNERRFGENEKWTKARQSHLAIGKLLEIIKSTPCTFDIAYEKSGKETKISNAKCIDMNIDYRDGKRDIKTFKELAFNLLPEECSDGEKRVARRRGFNNFKYYVNPLCVADVEYVDANIHKAPIWNSDVKFWLWSKTTKADRENMYKKLTDEINNDTYHYFRNLNSSDDGTTARSIAKNIIKLVKEKDEEWHRLASSMPTTPPSWGTPEGWRQYHNSKINKRVERLKNNFKKKTKSDKVNRGIIMAMIRLSALLFIIYKAFDIGYSKHLYVDRAEQSGGRRSKSGGGKKIDAKSTAKLERFGRKLSDTKKSFSDYGSDFLRRADLRVAGIGDSENAMATKDIIRSNYGANIRSGLASVVGVEDDDGTFLSKFINLMNSALKVCADLAATEFTGSRLGMIPKSLKVLLGVAGCIVGYLIYFAILLVAFILTYIMKMAKYLFISLPSQTKEMVADDDQRNIFYNFVMTLIKLIPFIVVFNVVGLWFAPIYGLAACVAFAIFVQFKFISFTLFGTKDSHFIKKHIKENRFGLTLLASVMITFSSAKNLKPQTAFGVALASAISMLILACGV